MYLDRFDIEMEVTECMATSFQRPTYSGGASPTRWSARSSRSSNASIWARPDTTSAQPLHETLSIPPSARASFYLYNTVEEVKVLSLGSKAEYGSFNTRKGYASLGSEHLDGKFNQVYSLEYFDTDGYRDNSDYDRQNFYGKWFYHFTDALTTGLVLHTYDADWHTAGYLPEYLWTQNPKQSIQEDDGGWKDLSEAQLHLDWDITQAMPLEFKAWAVDEDYSRWADWGGGQTESHYEHRILGALANLGYDLTAGDTGLLRFDTGFDWRSFSTLEQKFNTTYRHRTELTSDNDYDLNDFGVYAKVNYDPFASLRLFAGGRYDLFSGETTDNSAGIARDMRDYDIWRASGGVIYSFQEHYSLYANTGTGFQLPQGSDKYQVNAPSESDLLHWEIGTKAEWEHVLLRYAYFHSDEDTIRWIAGE